MQPTDEQIKEFWEWCGGKFVADNYNDNEPEHFVMPNGGMIYPIVKLDLNNLFLYATEKIRIKIGDIKFAVLMRKWLRQMFLGEDPALALFWAIYEVMK